MHAGSADRDKSGELYESAVAHCGRGRYDRAMEDLEAALRADADNAEAHALMGVCLRVAGRSQEAITAYRRALSLDPELFTARYNLGAALYLLGRYEEAAREYEAAMRLDPADADPGHRLTAANLAHCYRDMGRTERAKEVMGRAGLTEADLLSPSEWSELQRDIRRGITPPGGGSKRSTSPFFALREPADVVGGTISLAVIAALILHFALHRGGLESGLLGLAIAGGLVAFVALAQAEGRRYAGGVGPVAPLVLMGALGTLGLRFLANCSWPVAALSGALATGFLWLVTRAAWEEKTDRP